MVSSLLRQAVQRIPKHRLSRLMRFYPPYLGAGIRVTDVAEDLLERRAVGQTPAQAPVRLMTACRENGRRTVQADRPVLMLKLSTTYAPAYEWSEVVVQPQ